MNKKIVFITLAFFLLLSFLGFTRDFVFVAINARMKYLLGLRAEMNFPEKLLFLENFTYQQLYNLKWFLTVFTSLLYLIIYLGCIKMLYKEKKYLWGALICFAAIYLLSGLFYLYGWLANDLETGYSFARIFMGFIQSPFLLMLLIPAFLLEKKWKVES